METKRKDLLNEKGFVFMDHSNKPYWCTMYHGKPWIMYWHQGNKAWVTLREVNNTEIWLFNERRIPDDQANFYHDEHEKFMSGH